MRISAKSDKPCSHFQNTKMKKKRRRQGDKNQVVMMIIMRMSQEEGEHVELILITPFIEGTRT